MDNDWIRLEQIIAYICNILKENCFKMILGISVESNT